MQREGFYVVRCPQCGRYTFAPIRQKTRLCVYCQHIFKVNPLGAEYVEDARTARTKVKLYQTGKQHDEFLAAVERSRERVAALLPKETLSLDMIRDKESAAGAQSARRHRLEEILSRFARNTAADLPLIERECEKVGLPWSWVSRQLESLIRSGQLVCPKPWQVRLVAAEDELQTKLPSQQTVTTLARRIGEIIRKASMPISEAELKQLLERQNLGTTRMEEALEALRLQGYVIKTREGTLRWVAQ
jgi:hypothetical protein